MDYTEMVRSDVFLLEQMQRQQDMRRYIKEAQILSSGVDVAYRLNSINEDLGDSLKGLWAKIKTIFNKIWLKFLESLNKMIMNDAEYLKTYQGIILNKKAPDVTYTLPNYEEARKRCFAGIPDFTAYINVSFVEELEKKALEGTKEGANKDELKQQWVEAVRAAFVKKDGITDYKEGDDFAAACNAFFGGGDDMDIAGSSINMTDVYNLVSTSDTIVTELQKTRTKYTAWITEVEKRYNAEYKKMMDLVRKEEEETKKKTEHETKAAEARTNGDSAEATKHTDAANAAQQAIQKAQVDQKSMDSVANKEDNIKKAQATEVHNNSFNLYSVIYGTTLNEKVGISNGAGSSTTAGGDSNVVTSGPATNVSGVATSSTKQTIKNSAEAGRKQGQSQASKQADAAGSMGAAAATDNRTQHTIEQVNNFTSMVTTYSQICTETITTIFGAKCNGITKMRKDYMEIIRYHVRYWLGKQNDTDDNKSTEAPSTDPSISNATKTEPVKAPGT